MSFWYLASPYSKYTGGLEAACHLAAFNAGLLIEQGVLVFSPIAHSHTIARAAAMNPLSHDIWMPVDMPFVQAAHGLIVLMLPGWRESYGVNLELEHFEAAGKPVIYMFSGKVPAKLLKGALETDQPSP